MPMGSSRTKKSIKNVIAGFFCQSVTLILNFVARSIFVRILSNEYLGINGLFSNILTILSFAELGIGEALSFAMYRPAKEGNQQKLQQLMQVYKLAYRGIAALVTIVGLILSFFLDYLVAEKPNIPENFQVIFWLFLLNNVSSYLLTYKQSILLVDQKKYVVLYIQQGAKIFQILLQIGVLLSVGSYYGFLLIQVLCTGLSNVILSVYVQHTYPWLQQRGSLPPLEKSETKKIFSDVKALAISKVAGVVSSGTDNIVIAKIIGLTSVGIVSNYTMVINSASTILWGALAGVTGSLGNFNVSAKTSEKQSVFDELFILVYWIYAVCCACMIAVLNPFIEIWLGNQYSVDAKIVIALVLIAFVNGINLPVYTFRVTSGLFDQMKWPYFFWGIGNIMLSILLAFKSGLFGVYIATVISRILICEIPEGYIVYKNILHRPVWRYYVRYLMGMALMLILGAVSASFCQMIMVPGIIGFLLKATVSFLSCNIALLLCFGWRPEFRRLVGRAVKLSDKKSKKEG